MLDPRIRSRSVNHYAALFATWSSVQGYRSEGQLFSCMATTVRNWYLEEVQSLSPYTVCKVRHPVQNFLRSLRLSRAAYPLLAFVLHLMETKHGTAQLVQCLRLPQRDRASGVTFRMGAENFLFLVPNVSDNHPVTKHLGFFVR